MGGSSVLGVPRLLVQMYISPTLSPSGRAEGVKIWSANFIHSCQCGTPPRTSSDERLRAHHTKSRPPW